MAAQAPIFEQTTSPLYYSNDARLHLVRESNGGITPPEFALILVPDKPVVEYESGTPVGEEVFRTYDRVQADAYIAGWDLARSTK